MAEPSGTILSYRNDLEVPHRHVADEPLDLVYLDPPFNLNVDEPCAKQVRKGAAVQ